MRSIDGMICLLLEKDYLTFSLMLSMRPIHRPIHEMAVLPEVWDKMSPAEQAEARAQGKLRAPVRETDDLNHPSSNFSASSLKKNSWP